MEGLVIGRGAGRHSWFRSCNGAGQAGSTYRSGCGWCEPARRRGHDYRRAAGRQLSSRHDFGERRSLLVCRHGSGHLLADCGGARPSRSYAAGSAGACRKSGARRPDGGIAPRGDDFRGITAGRARQRFETSRCSGDRAAVRIGIHTGIEFLPATQRAGSLQPHLGQRAGSHPRASGTSR